MREYPRGINATEKNLLLLPPVVFLVLVAMDLLGPLPTIKRGQKNVLIITDRNYNLTRVIAMNKMQAPKSKKTFLDSCTMT